MSGAPLLIAVLRQPALMAGLGLADWDLLLRQAGSARLVGRLRSLLTERSLLDTVPPQPRTHLDWAATLALRHRRAVHWEVEQIRRALSGLSLRPVLLKGAAYAVAGLPPADGRMFSDIDILVPKPMLDEVEAALMMHGWVGTHTDAYDQRYYREWMHELPPMQNIKRDTLIDVHHAILPETARARPDPARLRAAAVAIDGEPGFLTLAPADMVLHSTTHLFYGEFEHGLRDLVDIERLLRHFSADPAFWDGLVARARELELGRPLFYALRWADRLLGAAVPGHVMENSRLDAPNRLVLGAMDWLLGHAMLPAHPSIDRPATAPARLMLYIRANWLRMPPLLLARHLFHKAFLSPKTA
ncbi:nucleotidyltransferase domain-containing protein [Massilia soli]|uniref:Nucleotidyltransferase family protein n=1 Tax=Massilia soli TaxID=2792854 RepID=A0ABS7SJK5_9BURK|nr:nucleotidyltransferase family protein [Massilia soli]MBZ2206119.1 nucleotidyltransferase family protein [Massilia soli]